jgi:hypothetical protein
VPTTTGEDRTVAIDWSFVGIAPAGQDLAILIGGSRTWLDAEANELTSMSKRAFASYIEGLQQSGWRGDERVVRFAYAASTVLYVAPIVWVERKCGRLAEDIARAWVVLLDHALELAEEACTIVSR